MKKILFTLFALVFTGALFSQYNMVAFRHLSFDVEAGLHGLGVEAAIPVSRNLVLKGGYNWAPAGELFNTDFSVNTAKLKQAQQDYSAATGHQFQNWFADESVINAGIEMGLSNYKLMVNWYPIISGRFYVAGGIYYSTSGKAEAFMSLKGRTTANDWAALKELREKTGKDSYNIEVEIGNETYPVIEDEKGRGTLQADLKIDPLKYYLGAGLGRCVPNGHLGLQLEMGVMICRNSTLYCQEREVRFADVLDGSIGNEMKEIVEYVDKFPIYPQLTLRMCFRLF